mmetsp:Transcript_12127/g.30078  ORF Transcript_12127/g.30078 Transcript_12127/m.30078 type:complete len:480 (+) Transcript_12127:1744-3183(+)
MRLLNHLRRAIPFQLLSKPPLDHHRGARLSLGEEEGDLEHHRAALGQLPRALASKARLDRQEGPRLLRRRLSFPSDERVEHRRLGGYRRTLRLQQRDSHSGCLARRSPARGLEGRGRAVLQRLRLRDRRPRFPRAGCEALPLGENQLLKLEVARSPREVGWLQAKVRRRLWLRARGDEEAHDLLVPRVRRGVQRLPPVLRAGVDGDGVVEQPVRHLVVATARGDVQRLPPHTRRRGERNARELLALRVEPADDVQLSRQRRVVERLPAVGVDRRRAAPVGRSHQPLQELEVPAARGEVRWLVPLKVLRAQVGALVPRDEARELRLAGVRRRVHRLPAVLRRGEHRRARLEQPLRRAVEAVGARVVERLPAVGVLRAHVAPRLCEELRHVHLAGRGGRVEGRRPVVGLELPQVRRLAQQAIHLDEVAVASDLEDLLLLDDVGLDLAGRHDPRSLCLEGERFETRGVAHARWGRRRHLEGY